MSDAPVNSSPDEFDLTPSITIGEAPYVIVLPDGSVLRGGMKGTTDAERDKIRSGKQG